MIRTKDNTVLVPIPTTYIYPRGISISPDGAYLFIGLQVGVEAIVNMVRLTDNKVVSSVRIPGTLMSIAVRPDGSRIFVTDHDDDKCYAFDIDGENLTLATVANLDGEPGSRPAPIGVVVVENPVSSQTLPTNENSSQPYGGKSSQAAPSFSSIVSITALLLLSRLFWHRG